MASAAAGRPNIRNSEITAPPGPTIHIAGARNGRTNSGCLIRSTSVPSGPPALLTVGGVKIGPILYCATCFTASARSSGVKSIRSSRRRPCGSKGAGFVGNGCVAEVVMDDKLLGQLRSAKTATFIIFETPEEGIGFPLSLNGLSEGFDKLP